MKNVTLLTKLRRLIKSLAISFLFLVLGLAGSSFTSSSINTDGIKKPGRDSLASDKNSFPGLFASNTTPGLTHTALFNPAAIKFVQDFVEENSDRLNRMKIWGKPYFDIFDGILSQYNLPVELKYLSVVESSLNQTARSRVGAGGPWQIMPTEARRLGLKVNSKVDERNNYIKSTHAAARFLKELYAQFNDWLLVIAAYNCGPGRLNQAIRRSGTKDFWKLQSFLPAETRNHVKKFIGTHYVFEGSGGITTMTAAEINNYNVSLAGLSAAQQHLTQEELNRTMAVQIAGKYNAKIIAHNVGMDIKQFNHLNPDFDKLMMKGNPQTLRLPVDKMMAFDNKKQLILQESVKALLK